MEESSRPEVSRMLLELESLKATKREIEIRISSIEAALCELRAKENGEEEPHSKSNWNSNSVGSSPSNIINGISEYGGHGLSPDMIYRYSRHLLLPSIGVQGQSNLLNSSILVVGAGGLGSPALLYLAACGVGRLGIVDHDVVELNNLHRQIIHTEEYIGRPKVESAAATCRSINSTVQIVEYEEALRTSNALDIISKYDVVIDATDNVPSRYMISDCCVVLGKPLISGAALGLEGQLTIYNYKGGPCYRCLFPTPPPTTACQRCSDSGVLGIVPGIIGCLQALEALKVAGHFGDPLSGQMLLLDAQSTRIRVVKIRGRSLQCEACGETAALTRQQFQDLDYEEFTQSPLSTSPLKLNLLPADARISSEEYSERMVNGEAHVLVDVRPAHHYKIVSLPNSLNIPLSRLEDRLPEISSALKREEMLPRSDAAAGGDGGGRGSSSSSSSSSASARLYVICRRGNDSQRAVQYLHKMGIASAMDIIGGLESWARDVDPKFPIY